MDEWGDNELNKMNWILDICPYLNEAGYNMKKGHFTDINRNDPTSMKLDLQWPDGTMYAFSTIILLELGRGEGGGGVESVSHHI